MYEISMGKIHMTYSACFIRLNSGFSLIELLITMAIITVISSITVVSYNGYIDATNKAVASNHIRTLAFIIKEYAAENGTYPNSLSDIDNANLLDPWGQPYTYLRFNETNLGFVRKDRNLVPLNTNFDLYSRGKDKDSRPPLSVPVSHDDIIYANDGGFIGLASDY